MFIFRKIRKILNNLLANTKKSFNNLLVKWASYIVLKRMLKDKLERRDSLNKYTKALRKEIGQSLEFGFKQENQENKSIFDRIYVMFKSFEDIEFRIRYIRHRYFRLANALDIDTENPDSNRLQSNLYKMCNKINYTFNLALSTHKDLQKQINNFLNIAFKNHY